LDRLRSLQALGRESQATPASVATGIRAVLARPKGRPAGLEHFSTAAFRARVASLLDAQPR